MDAQQGYAGNYEDGMACAKCYAKHLAKAIVELGEYSEDTSRIEELSLCMGDIACAEDHAGALGLEEEKNLLRRCREMIWNTDNGAVKILRQLSVKATRTALFEADKERRERAYRLAAEAEKAAAEKTVEKTGQAPVEPSPATSEQA